ncbi:MAG: GYD domain-containing protein [Acidobacteria bacterium]|nr:GYD domain-containing protein [Acidobacteriota bacterium]
MAHYLLQVAYTPEAWAGLIRNPQDRIKALQPVVQKLGGRFEAAYFSFGEYDIIAIVEMPSNVDAAAFSLAAAAGGACKAIKTTPLMSVQEGVQAMQKAATIGYTPPAAAAV